MIRNTLLILLFLNTICSLSAKDYIKAEVEYKNGSIKEGYVEFPINSYEKKIKFRNSKDGKTQKIDSNNLESIIFSADGEFFKLLRFNRKMYRGKKEKIFKKSSWGILEGNCNGLSLIGEASEYKIKKGKLLLVYYDQHYPFIFFRREGEKYAASIATNYKFATFGIGIKAYFRKNAKKFFKDNPSLVKKINDKEFENIYELFAYYCTLTE